MMRRACLRAATVVVAAVCLALVLVMGFGGVGAALQLDRARGLHPDEAVDGVRAVLRVLVLFALVTPFWSLFDQKASTWVLQADQMAKPAWFQSSMMQALNPALVMILIPFNNLVLYPMLERAGLSIAMGNAPDPVKARADHVTTANDADGVAHAIDTIILPRTGATE